METTWQLVSLWQLVLHYTHRRRLRSLFKIINCSYHMYQCNKRQVPQAAVTVDAARAAHKSIVRYDAVVENTVLRTVTLSTYNIWL